MKTILEERRGLYSPEETRAKLDQLLNNDYNESVLPLVVKAVKEDEKYDFLTQQLGIDTSRE